MAIKKTKLMKQMLAILLALAITVTSCDWPMTVYAEDTYHGEEEVQIEEPDMVCEVESERTEYTKHYLMTDGSYVAAVYSEPVHYLENGKWEEIDNTLTEEMVEGTEVYQNRKGKHSVRFSESIDKKGVSIQNENGYTVSFTPVTDVERPEMKGERKETEELQSISMMKEEGKRDKKTEKMSLDKKTSGMKYADVYADADLEYVLTSSSLKENIVVKKAKDSYEYQFHADFGGLIPVQESDGSIGLYEEGAEQGLPEMRIEAPYMYDAEGTLSDAVTVTFEETEGHYIMMVTADPLWINDPERTFPVVIDPTVKLDVDRSDIKDTYVDTAAPSVNLKNDYYLYVGYNSLGTTRTYIKYDLPDLPDCSIVTGAALVLQQYEYDPGTGATNYIYAYDCADNSWDVGTITWNNQPMNKSSLSSYIALDYQIYQSNPSATQCAAYCFDITKAAKRWYEEGVNNGIMLASADESVKNRSRFCSANYSTDSRYFPSVWVSYVNNTGI